MSERTRLTRLNIPMWQRLDTMIYELTNTLHTYTNPDPNDPTFIRIHVYTHMTLSALVYQRYQMY